MFTIDNILFSVWALVKKDFLIGGEKSFLSAGILWMFHMWPSLFQYHDILIFWACLTGGPFPKSWRNSKLPARKTPQARHHGALALLLSSVRGADFFVRVAAAVRMHAVVSDHFSYKRTQTQSGNNCTPVHKCSCSLTQVDTPSVAGDKYTSSMTCIYTHRHSWLLHTFV